MRAVLNNLKNLQLETLDRQRNNEKIDPGVRLVYDQEYRLRVLETKVCRLIRGVDFTQEQKEETTESPKEKRASVTTPDSCPPNSSTTFDKSEDENSADWDTDLLHDLCLDMFEDDFGYSVESDKATTPSKRVSPVFDNQEDLISWVLKYKDMYKRDVFVKFWEE